MSGDYSIGSTKWPGVSKLIEECGEVLQVCGKLLGTGGQREHWDGSDLQLRLEEEIADVMAACTFVLYACKLDHARITDLRATKSARFMKWHSEGNKPPLSLTDARERLP